MPRRKHPPRDTFKVPDNVKVKHDVSGLQSPRDMEPPARADRRVQRAVRTPEGDETFFNALSLGWSISQSAEWAGYPQSTVYAWKTSDAEFKRRWVEAYGQGGDYLEDVARQRAVQGWLEPVFQGGVQVGSVRKFDSNILQAMLRARKPTEYGNRVEIGGGLALDTKNVPDARLNAMIVVLLTKAGVPAEIVDQLRVPELPVNEKSAAERAASPEEDQAGPALPPAADE